MAIENIIARGIGFTPGGVKFIVTHGLSIGAVVVPQIWTAVPKATAAWTPEGEESTTWTPETPESTTWTGC